MKLQAAQMVIVCQVESWRSLQLSVQMSSRDKRKTWRSKNVQIGGLRVEMLDRERK
jgi:hypothetical protein